MSLFRTHAQKVASRLYKAIDNHDLEKMKAAIAGGASVCLSPESRYGSPPLTTAAYNNFTDGIRYLIEQGAKADEVGRDTSALHYAVENDNLAIVTMLLDAGADINAKRYDGFTPLHLAARRGHGNIIRALIARGADIEATDLHMNTPADLAEKEYPRISDMIRASIPAAQKLLEAARPEEGADDWSLTGPEEIACVSVKAAIGYRLTEIFNFRAGIYTRIAHNLQSGAESQSVRFFDEFSNRVAIDDAQRTFLSLGGNSAVLKAEKPALKPQGFPKA